MYLDPSYKDDQYWSINSMLEVLISMITFLIDTGHRLKIQYFRDQICLFIFSLFYKQLVNLLINKEKLLFKGPFPKAWASELSEVNKTNLILFLYRTNIDYSSDCQSIILMTMEFCINS